jgi:hypothetical protein
MPSIDPEQTITSDDARSIEKILVLNRNVVRARARFEHWDQVRKTAKEALEEEQAVLNQFIASLDQEMPLFDGEIRTGPRLDVDAELTAGCREVEAARAKRGRKVKTS